MPRVLCSVFLVVGMVFGLSACAELDVALYGSEEKAQIAREESEARRRNDSIKKQRKMEAEMYAMIQQVRKENGVFAGRPMFADGQEVAQMRAKELSEKFSETRPGGGKYYTLTKEIQSKVAIKKELRAQGMDPKRVLDGWMKKPESRALILRRDISGFGVGVYMKNYTYYWAFEVY